MSGVAAVATPSLTTPHAVSWRCMNLRFTLLLNANGLADHAPASKKIALKKRNGRSVERTANALSRKGCRNGAAVNIAATSDKASSSHPTAKMTPVLDFAEVFFQREDRGPSREH